MGGEDLRRNKRNANESERGASPNGTACPRKRRLNEKKPIIAHDGGCGLASLSVVPTVLQSRQRRALINSPIN